MQPASSATFLSLAAATATLRVSAPSAVGKPAAEIKQTLKGITCGSKDTSCPDQLAAALEQMGY
jgi:hypothetical protein